MGTRALAPIIALPNQRWRLDFVHNQMASGRRFLVLNVVDGVRRACLAAVAGHLDLRPPCRARIGRADQSAGQAGDDRQLMMRARSVTVVDQIDADCPSPDL